MEPLMAARPPSQELELAHAAATAQHASARQDVQLADARTAAARAEATAAALSAKEAHDDAVRRCAKSRKAQSLPSLSFYSLCAHTLSSSLSQLCASHSFT